MPQADGKSPNNYVPISFSDLVEVPYTILRNRTWDHNIGTCLGLHSFPQEASTVTDKEQKGHSQRSKGHRVGM